MRLLKDRLNDVVLYIVQKSPFFGFAIPKFHLIEDTNNMTSTSAVDIKGNIFYNSNFFNELNDKQIITVIYHEMLHVLLNHFIRSEQMDDIIANIAQDLVINDILINLEDNESLPSNYMWDADNITDGFFIPDKKGYFIFKKANNQLKIKIRHRSFEDIYDEIYDFFQDDKNSNTLKQIDNNFKYGGFDTHILPSDVSSKEKNDLANQWEETFLASYVKNEQENNNRTEKSDSWLNVLFNHLVKSQLDWRSLLRRVINRNIPFDYSYAKPSRRSSSIGIYQPYLIKESLNVIVAVDVSGSIGDREITQFFSEIYSILNQLNNVTCRTIFWSTKVDEKNDKTFTKNNLHDLLTSFSNINSTGGTYLSCVAEYLSLQNNKYDIIIYLTDGYVEDNPIYPNIKEKLIILSERGNKDPFVGVNTVKLKG